MIFESGNLQVSATGQNDALTALVGEARELSASESNSEQKSNEGKVLSYQEISLPIDYKVSPSLKLIVFVKDGNQTLTDFHTYHVEACQNHEVKAEWSDEKCSLEHQSLSQFLQRLAPFVAYPPRISP